MERELSGKNLLSKSVIVQNCGRRRTEKSVYTLWENNVRGKGKTTEGKNLAMTHPWLGIIPEVR